MGKLEDLFVPSKNKDRSHRLSSFFSFASVKSRRSSGSFAGDCTSIQPDCLPCAT
jgi:hypothetical protein